MKFSYNTSALGKTRESLTELELAIYSNNERVRYILQVNTDRNTCGFAVIRKTNKDWNVKFSGNGFRRDRNGDGGSGYLKAIKMITEFVSKNQEIHCCTGDKLPISQATTNAKNDKIEEVILSIEEFLNKKETA